LPKIVDSVAQRREIRGAARRVFARRGVTATGLVQVAEAAGMGRSSLYHYYRDRSSLVRELLRDLLAEEEAFFVAAAQGAGSPLARLERLARGIPGIFDEWAMMGRLLLELRSSDARLFRPYLRRICSALASLIDEGQRVGEVDRDLDPKLTAMTLVGVIDGILLQYIVDPGSFADREALLGGLADVMMKIVRPAA
jgi:TetR/AcrR family acrAB operon transcriptional repressor